VDDHRPRRRTAPASPPAAAHACPDETSDAAAVARLLGRLDGGIELPRRNGELVFEEPWQARAFGMAVALHEAGLFPWEDFRRELIAQVARAEAAGGPFEYYEAWLAAFECVLAARGLVQGDEVEESSYAFEFGERDDVY